MIFENISLKKYNTFGLDYKADYLINIRSEEEARSLFTGKTSFRKPLLILGGGSNILFTDDFRGTIIFPDIEGINIEKAEFKDGNVIVSAGSGVVWDKFVEWTVDRGFGGLENLSLIPGKVGAAPVQNIGAYGVEVKDYIEKVRTVSVYDGSVRIFNKEECEFGYRNSVFKNREKGKYLVTRVFFKLSDNPVLNLFYDSLKEEVSRIGQESVKNIRHAVINIRKSKLPDPEETGNAGSFFKNPVVTEAYANHLRVIYPEMPVFDEKAGSKKLAAGWLIERCGWKGKRTNDAGVHPKQALVIVNYGKATGTEIFSLSQEIKRSVWEKFGIELEREVEVI
jgi:UDP-N-acetylmuramate dehydrogenase